ncbi:MAG: hypothetical protein WC319_05740 [Candidatus Paceibacterota bacterium]|jgi:hypothetical protein
MKIEFVPEEFPIYENEKIVEWKQGNLVGLELFPESDSDRSFCDGLKDAYNRGDLHMSIVDSYLVIGYDGIISSFSIKKAEKEFLKKSFEVFWRRELKVYVACSQVWDKKGKSFCCNSCSIRFVKVKESVKFEQRKEVRLIKAYISPLPNEEKRKKPITVSKLIIQKTLTDVCGPASPEPAPNNLFKLCLEAKKYEQNILA